MEKDNKRQDEKNKITSFAITEEMLSDPEMDLLLKEGMIREADEMEKELNEDESLRGVGVSDDLFEVIVEKLREQGAWEREGEEEGEGQESPDSIYQLLSEEDRLNIEAGKRYRRQKERKKQKRVRRVKVWKKCGIVAAAAVFIVGLGMTSEANRRLMLQAWDGMMYNLNFRLSTNYSSEELVRSRSRDEIVALEAIRKTLGTKIIEFEYLPEGMEYKGYDIFDDNKGAHIFYFWKEKLFSVSMTYMSNTNQDSSSYVVVNEGAECVDIVKNEQEIEFCIWKTDQTLKSPMYVVEAQYNGFRYVMSGIESMEEIKKIAKYSLIL